MKSAMSAGPSNRATGLGILGSEPESHPTVVRWLSVFSEARFVPSTNSKHITMGRHHPKKKGFISECNRLNLVELTFLAC